MSDSTRFFAKKELKRACGNLSWALKHIARVSDKYRKYHPEISDVLDSQVSNTLAVHNEIEYIEKNL